MGIFDFLKGSKEIKGEIGYFGLTEWWLSEFSDEERDHIIKKFQPLGGSGESLIRGKITSTSQTAIGLLSALAGWFNNEQDRTIAYRMLKKAEDMVTDNTDILDVHFLFNSKEMKKNRTVPFKTFKRVIRNWSLNRRGKCQ